MPCLDLYRQHRRGLYCTELDRLYKKCRQTSWQGIENTENTGSPADYVHYIRCCATIHLSLHFKSNRFIYYVQFWCLSAFCWLSGPDLVPFLSSSSLAEFRPLTAWISRGPDGRWCRFICTSMIPQLSLDDPSLAQGSGSLPLDNVQSFSVTPPAITHSILRTTSSSTLSTQLNTNIQLAAHIALINVLHSMNMWQYYQRPSIG